MGDGFVVSTFAQHVRQPVAEWQQALTRQDSTGMECYTRCLVTGRMTDLSFTGYADDLCKKVLAPTNTFAELKEKAANTSRILAECSEKWGYSQNKDKEVALPVLLGKGSRAEIAELRRQAGLLPGTWADEARYLGCLVHGRLNNTGEVQK